MRRFPPKPSVGTECRYIVLFSRTLFTLPMGVRLPGREQEININDMELTLTTTDINIMDVFKKSRERRRIEYWNMLP